MEGDDDRAVTPVVITYTLQLFLNSAVRIEVPGFVTHGAAELAGLFLQTLRDDVYLYEIRTVRA